MKDEGMGGGGGWRRTEVNTPGQNMLGGTSRQDGGWLTTTSPSGKQPSFQRFHTSLGRIKRCFPLRTVDQSGIVREENRKQGEARVPPRPAYFGHVLRLT